MLDPINWVKKSELRKHRRQRTKRGFSDFDWWNFDEYLAFVIIGGLTKFRDEGMGYPAHLTDQEWTDRLNKMIEGFESVVKLNETYDDAEYQRLSDKWHEGAKLFVEHFPSLWD